MAHFFSSRLRARSLVLRGGGEEEEEEEEEKKGYYPTGSCCCISQQSLLAPMDGGHCKLCRKASILSLASIRSMHQTAHVALVSPSGTAC